MDYRKYVEIDIISIYKNYYASINGGIDGYYETTILEAEIYEVYDTETVAYFSVYPERGLTSLYVLSENQENYDVVFDFVLSLSLFQKILFTSTDQRFLNAIKSHHLRFEIQAYDFSLETTVISNIKMKSVAKKDFDSIDQEFGEFISYNHIQLDQLQSFICEEEEDQLISFGALEPLKLNENRYCISMIVNENFRRKGIGQETVKYLLEHLQRHQKEVNARCYVLNEASKRTLLKSGMRISNYLYKIENKNQLITS